MTRVFQDSALSASRLHKTMLFFNNSLSPILSTTAARTIVRPANWLLSGLRKRCRNREAIGRSEVMAHNRERKIMEKWNRNRIESEIEDDRDSEMRMDRGRRSAGESVMACLGSGNQTGASACCDDQAAWPRQPAISLKPSPRACSNSLTLWRVCSNSWMSAQTSAIQGNS